MSESKINNAARHPAPEPVPPAEPSKKRQIILLIALAVLALVALIYLWRTTQAKQLSQARMDLQSTAAALRDYKYLNNELPPMLSLAELAHGRSLPSADNGELHTYDQSTLRVEFVDPYSPGGDLPFAWHSNDEGWILYSPGPDRVYDLTAELIDQHLKRPESGDALPAEIMQREFDPQTGKGDLIQYQLNPKPKTDPEPESKPEAQSQADKNAQP
ncbi:hypothetical protein JXA32_10270 [Candidatus Sumerlaeota bacterium]|nr:hypothetical protein [Candidatus Sumerlaeota bacterium]